MLVLSATNLKIMISIDHKRMFEAENRIDCTSVVSIPNGTIVPKRS